MMKRKFVCILCLFLISVLLFGCGAEKPENPQPMNMSAESTAAADNAESTTADSVHSNDTAAESDATVSTDETDSVENNVQSETRETAPAETEGVLEDVENGLGWG